MNDSTEPQTERDESNSKDTANFWQVQLGLADRDQQQWEKEARLVVERYRAERKSAARRDAFNIPYSNTETLNVRLWPKRTFAVDRRASHRGNRMIRRRIS